MKIAWLGLGNMGSVMAARALAAGHELVLYNRTRKKAEGLLERGARFAETPGGAVTGAELVVTMLADDAALRDVLEAGGALDAMAPDSVHVSMSTISPALAQELAARHAARRVGFVGAPVFGRPDAAAAGKLFVLTGGDPAAVSRAQPLFEALAQKVLSLGPAPEAAHLTKVLGNFMLLSSVKALAEALDVAHSSGLAPQALLEALTGSVFSAPFYAGYGKLLVEQNFDRPAAFTVGLAKKDLDLAVSAARRVDAPLPTAMTVLDKLEELLGAGSAQQDVTAIGRFTKP
ncbi:MAG: NAD(P)-dependent oxidoreductase [Myxococcales bacterium]|nr:MAG: NAD(P)-dependent oxidoreductase [Myxococcales bacterium]